MKICILAPRFPFPENGGDVLRINNIARYLRFQGHSLCLISFGAEDGYEKLDKELYSSCCIVRRSKILSLFNSCISLLSGKPIQIGYYYSNRFLKQFKNFIKSESPDLYISHLLRMEPYLKKCGLESKSIIEMTDALSKTYSLSANSKGFSLKKLVYAIEKKRIAKFEQYVVSKYKKVVLVSESDKNLLGNQQSLSVYTNGVSCLPQITADYNPMKISFVGNMRTLQNQDAVLYFVNDIFPIIKERFPNAFFEIIGAQPSPQIQALHDGKNIFVTGFVESVEEELKDSCVTIAPVRIAAGIQNKVLVAMACGIPVVLTPLISKAIPELKDGENCFIQEDTRAIASALIKILDDSGLRNKLAVSGYEMVKNHYSWNSKLTGYEKF